MCTGPPYLDDFEASLQLLESHLLSLGTEHLARTFRLQCLGPDQLQDCRDSSQTLTGRNKDGKAADPPSATLQLRELVENTPAEIPEMPEVPDRFQKSLAPAKLRNSQFARGVCAPFVCSPPPPRARRDFEAAEAAKAAAQAAREEEQSCDTGPVCDPCSDSGLGSFCISDLGRGVVAFPRRNFRELHFVGFRGSYLQSTLRGFSLP